MRSPTFLLACFACTARSYKTNEQKAIATLLLGLHAPLHRTYGDGKLNAARQVKRRDVLGAGATAAALASLIFADPRAAHAVTDAEALGLATQERHRLTKDKRAALKLRGNQCEYEREVLKTKDIEDTNILPATEDPSQPASCVGYKLYRVSDPKLEPIYETDSDLFWFVYNNLHLLYYQPTNAWPLLFSVYERLSLAR